jgi:PHYB activation tagged suppressor 1
VLDGYTIPKDVGILVPIMKIHRSPKYWGDDAHEFKPERFEKEEIKKIHPYAYLPFTSEFTTFLLSLKNIQQNFTF